MIDDQAETLRTLILGAINRRHAAIAPAHLHRKPQNQHAAAKARAHELNALAAFVLTVRLPSTHEQKEIAMIQSTGLDGRQILGAG